MVDIISSDENLKKMLIFRNQKFAANGLLFEKVVSELNERSKNYSNFTITSTQARNKFKKMISECKAISLAQRTASGISRYKIEKGYGKWWDILFPLVASRESSDPSMLTEPSEEDTLREDLSTEDDHDTGNRNAEKNLTKNSEKIPLRPSTKKKIVLILVRLY